MAIGGELPGVSSEDPIDFFQRKNEIHVGQSTENKEMEKYCFQNKFQPD